MINIEYKWDQNLAIKSSKDIYEYELQNSKKKYIGWLFIALVQFGVVGALKHQVYGLLMISTFLIFYWYGFRWPLREFFIKRTFSKSPLANNTIQLQAKKDGIYKDNKLQISYKDIKNIIQLKDAILIYHKFGTLYFPNYAFNSKNELKKFINFINH